MIYNQLGTDIMINAIVYASDVDEVENFILNELSRRGRGGTAMNPSTGQVAYRSVISAIDSNCRSVGYTGSGTIADIPTASDIRRYINYAKQLYLQNLRP